MDLKTQWDFFASWMRARFADSDRGATMVEYALMVALIAVVCIAAVSLIGNSSSSKFSTVGNSINAAS
jgi:pilus assembly protein Flp/PilA